jgi:hypothetical protein
MCNDDRRVAHFNLQYPSAIEEQPRRTAKGVDAQVEKLGFLQGVAFGEGVRFRHGRMLSAVGVNQKFVEPHQNLQRHGVGVGTGLTMS